MKVVVKYWRGTTQMEVKASSYEGALLIASRNQNAYPATFYDEQGNELYDTGFGLAYPELNDEDPIVYAL